MPLFRSRAQRNHLYAAGNLSAYLDDALPSGERQRIEDHLSICAECRSDLASLRQTVALLRRATMRTAPRSFALPLSAQPEQRAYRRWSSAYGTLRTASVVVSLLLVLFFSGDALFGRWSGPLGQQPDMATMREAAPEEALAAAPVRMQDAPMRAMAPMAAPAEAAVELPQLSPAPPMGTVVVEKEVALSPKLAPAMGGGGEVSSNADAPPPMSVPKPSGVGPVAAPADERRISSAATPDESVVLSAAPQAEAVLPADTSHATLFPSPTFFASLPERGAARAVTLAPLATPEAKLAAREAPETSELSSGALADGHSPVAAGPGVWWRVWYAVRMASGVLVGLLLMLVAGLLWVAPRRRI